MGLPQVNCACAFANFPNTQKSSATWTNLSQWLLSGECEYGRRDERQDFSTGKATAIMDNRDRRFSPKNSSSPYSPNLKKMKRFRVQAVWSAVTYDLFSGYVESWPTIEREGLRFESEVSLVDVLELLNNDTILTDSVGRPAEDSGTRIQWLLNNWSILDQDIEFGSVIVQPLEPLTEYNTLSAIRDAAKAEGGLFFAQGDGDQQYHSRYHRLVSQGTNQATFGDGAGELPFIDAPTSDNIEMVINTALAKRVGSEDPPYVYQDTQSFGDYMSRSVSEELITEYDFDAEAWAATAVETLKDPPERITSITISGQMDDNIWPHQLGRQIGDKITVNKRYFGKGSLLSQVSRIERIKHSWSKGSFVTEWGLSPVPAIESAALWKLGAAGSQLGTNTILAY